MAKGYVYFIQIGEPEERLFKIGTTNNIARRMSQHRHYYKKDVKVLWVSPQYSGSTTLAVEKRMINTWRKVEGFHYVPKDRFYIDKNIKQVTIKVRKEWVVNLP